MLKHRGFFVSRQGRVVKIVLERAKACGRHFPGAKEARIEEVGVGAALPKMAQGDAFGAEAENHFIDDGKGDGVSFLLWGEPGGSLSGVGFASAFPKTAQADAFGAEAENHFIDDGKDEGVRYLLWSEPGRGLSGGRGSASALSEHGGG